MVLTDRSLFEIYLTDLNVPIAYIILTIALFLICRYKKIPLIYTVFLWLFAGFGLAFLLDVVYDYQMKIFYLHNLTLTEGLAFLAFPFPTYAFLVFIWKFGRKRIGYILYFLGIPIFIEIFLVKISMEITFKDYSYFIRYCYVLAFIVLLLELKPYERINRRKRKDSVQGVVTT